MGESISHAERFSGRPEPQGSHSHARSSGALIVAHAIARLHAGELQEAVHHAVRPHSLPAHVLLLRRYYICLYDSQTQLLPYIADGQHDVNELCDI
jgi:hypothetical protein